jgi:ferredoxin
VDHASVCRAVEARGLVPRGAFQPVSNDAVPAMADGRRVATLVLVGVVGRSSWDAFQAAEESRQSPNPLDRWSRRVLGELAAALGAEAIFPFGGPPYLPFLRWAQRAEAVHPSPIGPLIHPDYGLWHAYRGALAFAEPIELPPADTRPRPCDTCADSPCLSTCPVGAFSARGYDVPACIDHIGAGQGADCLGGGCLARRACPVGVTYQYAPDQMTFHMRAFLAANRDAGRQK